MLATLAVVVLAPAQYLPLEGDDAGVQCACRHTVSIIPLLLGGVGLACVIPSETLGGPVLVKSAGVFVAGSKGACKEVFRYV